MQKRVAAIHDISGFGKCSLTVVLPILSAVGIETAVIPTAVLSTHTGGFTGYTYRDLTEDILPIADHWRANKLHFDTIYTGFVASAQQVGTVIDAVSRIRDESTMILVDPVMADNGELYKVFDITFPEEMKKLAAIADIITPNITEACLLTDSEYCSGPYTHEYIEQLLHSLSDVTAAKKIILTGVYFDDEQLGAACLDTETNEISFGFAKKINALFHGTGDVYSSALLGCIMNGKSPADAMKIAAEFTAGAIRQTIIDDKNIHYGVNFESQLPKLIKALGLS